MPFFEPDDQEFLDWLSWRTPRATSGPGIVPASSPVQSSDGEPSASPPPYAGPYPYSHDYGPFTTKVCDTSSPSCTLGNVFDALRRCPQPQYCGGTPVETGQTTNVGGVGDVEHEVCPDDHTVTNSTTPGHRLYPGQVTHRVVERDGSIWIETTGTGRSSSEFTSWLNQHAGGPVWERLHKQIIENYRNMYGKPSPWNPDAP